MNPQSPKFLKLAFLGLVLLLTVSCSKDTDLLADYVVSDSIDSQFLGNLVADDYYFMANNESIVLDVLSNDLLENPDKVKIVNISTPNNGTVVINEDKTLTYTVGSDSQSTQEKEIPEATAQIDAPTEQEKLEEKVTSEPEANQAPTETETPQPIQKQEVEAVPVEKEDSSESNNSSGDSFTYTLETENEDGTIDAQQGTVTISNDYGELKAFPTAEGFGKHTTGGRGGRVIHVTTLNDRGPGSLREAIYAEGKRTIVFDISGYIELTDMISVRSPNITIAGQTAPKPGITLRGGGISIQASNVIIRHLRIRPGYNAVAGADCINLRANKNDLNISNIIVDHCSLSWSKDENLAFDANTRFKNNSVKNVTVQNTINAEALKYYALLMGRNLDNISIIQNLFANVENRIPESSYGHSPESYEFNNNLIYNYNRPTKLAYGVEVDIIGNVYKAKETPKVPNMQYARNSIENPDGKASDGKIFQIDNIQIGSNPKGMTSSIWDANNRSSRVIKDSPYQTLPANSVEKVILTNVGATVFENNIDTRIIYEYRNNGGKRGVRHESEVGGYLDLLSEKRASNYDSDGDGMPDTWEVDNNLDPRDSTDGVNDENGDGYTNLEDFLHHLTLN